MRSAVPAQPPAAFTPHLPSPSLLPRDFLLPPRALRLPVQTKASPSSQRSDRHHHRSCPEAAALAWVRPGTGRALSPLRSCQRRSCSAPGTGPAWLRKGVLDRALGAVTALCRSTTPAERWLEHTRLGRLLHLYLARCLTNGSQLNVLALITGRTRKPCGVLTFNFFLVITSFL